MKDEPELLAGLLEAAERVAERIVDRARDAARAINEEAQEEARTTRLRRRAELEALLAERFGGHSGATVVPSTPSSAEPESIAGADEKELAILRSTVLALENGRRDRHPAR